MDGREEFTHQHVETTITALDDDLSGMVENLNAIGLTECRSDSGVVKRGDNALRSGLPKPIGRPKRVQAGIQNKDGVGLSEIAYGPGDCLGINLIGVAGQIRLLVQLLIR